MSILEELNYDLDMPTDGVIESKTEVVISSPSATHTASQNNTVRLYMNGSGYIDPHSVAIYADFSCSVTNADNVVPPTTYQLFESVRVLDGRGNVLEEVQACDLLATKLHEASSDSSFMDCAYGFTNSQKDVTKRVCSTIPTNFRISATDVLGIFNQSKFLHLPSFKGLQLELRCVSNATAFSVKTSVNTENNISYTLSNVKLHYTEVQVSRGYQQMYDEKVAQGGYALSYPTYFHLQNSATAGGSNQLSLNKTCSKAKAVFSTMRENGSRGVLVGKSETASDSRVSSYQYQINGKQYPPEPVTSKSKAYHELLESNGNRKNNTHSNICYEDFNNQWSWAAGVAKSDATLTYGTYAMWMDLEKSSSSPLSGVQMDANSSFLKVNVDGGVPSPIIDTFIIHERVLSVQPDRVVIVD